MFKLNHILFLLLATVATNAPDAKIAEETGKGLSLYKRGAYPEALECFKKVISMIDDTTTAELCNYKGLALHYQNDLLDAIACFDQALDKDNKLFQALFNKALSLRNLGKHYEALCCINSYLSKCDEGFGALNAKGLIYDELRDYANAIECFDELISVTAGSTKPELKELNILAWNNKAMSLANSGDYEGGLRIIDEQLSDKTNESFVLDTKGFILFKQEKYQEASEVLEKASKTSPGDKFVWYHRGNVFSKLGQPGQALRCYRKAIEIDQKFAEAYNDEAAELSMSGRYQEASEALEKALKIKPELVTAHENLIRISLRGQIHPTFWDFWNSSKYKRILAITIVTLSIYLIAQPLLVSAIFPTPKAPQDSVTTATTTATELPAITNFMSVPIIPVTNLIAVGILTVIILSPILSGAKVGPLEFTFLDSQRSAQPLSSAM